MKKILVANRGEIAVRIIRACQELGIQTVAVYSTADRDALHTKLADQSVCIGPAPSGESYLAIHKIMSAAEISGADGIHPGYGFLAENDEFASICESYGITFIGPSVDQIQRLGNKVLAREIATAAKVPLFPGSDGEVNSVQEAKAIAQSIGLPVIIKASAGGGGRGMKIVTKESELEKQYQIARSEAEACFGNPGVFIERYCMNPRHIEIQILADSHGQVLHLGERDCSIQRRHQKLIEESPSPAVDAKLRKKIGETAVRLVKSVDYRSVGTVEFLMDEDNQFYFMEVNTRIQVEHPVTEQVTGIDLIKEQIKVACGEKLRISQKDIKVTGHSIECRINAEDPKSFAPWPGTITDFHAPGGPGVRIDTMMYSGYKVPPNYDSMIGKVITFGEDRTEALDRMVRALREMKVDGIRTNIPFQIQVLSDPKFRAGDFSTKFLDTFEYQDE